MLKSENIAESVEALSTRKAEYILEKGANAVGDTLEGDEVTEEDLNILLREGDDLFREYQDEVRTNDEEYPERFEENVDQYVENLTKNFNDPEIVKQTAQDMFDNINHEREASVNAAGAVYAASLLTNNDIPQVKVSETAGVAESSLRKSYQEISESLIMQD